MSGGIYYICVNRHKCALVPISLGGVKLCGCETRRGNINVGGRNWTDCRASKGNHQFYSPALDIHVHKNVFFFLLSLFVLIPYTERISGIGQIGPHTSYLNKLEIVKYNCTNSFLFYSPFN